MTVTAQTLATAIAPHLGQDWTVVPPPEDSEDSRCGWADLQRTSDGALVRITVGGWQMEGRVAFRGVWPRFADGRPYWGGKTVSITCAATREPKALAKEITRRLLPEWDPAWAEAQAYVSLRDQQADEARAVAERIASTIGGTIGGDYTQRGDGIHVHGEPNGVYRLRVNPAYRPVDDDHHRPVCVSFEVHDLSPEVAAQVLALIQQSNASSVAAEPVRVSTPRLRVEPKLHEEEETEESLILPRTAV